MAQEAGLHGGVTEPKRHWWTRWTQLTSKRANDEAHASLAEREVLRRSRLLSWILLGMFAVELILLVLDSSDTATLLSVAIALSGTVASAALNRMGYVTAAGVLLVLLVMAAVMGAVTNSPGHLLDTVYLPAYDLLAIAVIIATSVLPRIAGFFVAGLSIGLICVDYFLQPHGADLIHQEQINGPLSMIARPIVLQVIVATVAFLWVRGAEEAIQRADRAEELAALEHAFAEQRRQLEIGVQQILETHVRVANGDFSARAPMKQDNLLWQIAASLNNLLSRLQKAGQAEYQLRRTEEEVRRLVSAIDEARQGRRPIWPAPTGTVADLLIERVVGSNRPLAPRDLPHVEPARAAFDGAVVSRPQPPSSSVAPYAVSGVFPTVPQTGHGSFLPPRLQPAPADAETPNAGVPPVADGRAASRPEPRELGALPELERAPEGVAERPQSDAEVEQADEHEHWPDLLRELADASGHHDADEPPAARNAPAAPPPNPYADMWEMRIEP